VASLLQGMLNRSRVGQILGVLLWGTRVFTFFVDEVLSGITGFLIVAFFN
jgi:hypothetical protein